MTVIDSKCSTIVVTTEVFIQKVKVNANIFIALLTQLDNLQTISRIKYLISASSEFRISKAVVDRE